MVFLLPNNDANNAASDNDMYDMGGINIKYKSKAYAENLKYKRETLLDKAQPRTDRGPLHILIRFAPLIADSNMQQPCIYSGTLAF